VARSIVLFAGKTNVENDRRIDLLLCVLEKRLWLFFLSTVWCGIIACFGLGESEKITYLKGAC
jgi:hypothetical protein